MTQFSHSSQERDRMEIFLGSHHFLLIMKHTPPPSVFPASAVLSIRKTEKLSDSVRDRRREPCFGQTKDVTVSNVPLETYPGSKIVHLILQGLDIGEQNTRYPQSVGYSSASPAVFPSSPAVIQVVIVQLVVLKYLQ